MNEKDDDSDEECFIPARWNEQEPNNHQMLPFSINSLLPQANNLHQISRPTQIHPRTCFGELMMTTLPNAVDSSYCRNQSVYVPPQKIQNCSLLDFEGRWIEDFVCHHRMVYNKICKYKQNTFINQEMSSRFKQLSMLSDYNKQTIKNLNKSSNTRKYSSVQPQDQFSSNFECGNLAKVYKNANQREFYLILENDVNSHGYTSWFFYKLTHTIKGQAKFHILNLAKKPTLFRMGMKIAIFSLKKNKQTGCQWFWGGDNIQVNSNIFFKKNKPSQSYYTLSFSYQFQQDDEIYFALTQPYTYSRIEREINKLSDKFMQQGVQFSVIKSVYSLSFNIVPIIQIKGKNKNQQENKQNKKQTKKSIVIMGRQHPAEVVGSFLMESIFNMMGLENQAFEQIIDKFDIVLIPMVNPDGVIHGNSRCNLAGLDLNRQWNDDGAKKMTPECQGLRKYLWNKLEDGGIQMLIDIHGHSKKLNSFFFCSKFNTNSLQTNQSSYFLPFVMSKIQQNFDFSSCTFSSTPDKKNTLRCQLQASKMPYCYTLENSYFGFWDGNSAKPFQKQHYDNLAASLLEAIKYVTLYKEKEIIEIISEKYNLVDQNFDHEMKKALEKISIETMGRSNLQKQLQSESDPQGDILNQEEVQKIIMTTSDEKKLSQIRVRAETGKKFKTRKKRTQFTQQKQKDDIRKSHPAKPHSEQQKNTIAKSYKSEKKIIIDLAEQKNNTQNKFYSTSKRERQKKMSIQKKQKKINTKNLIMGQKNQCIGQIKNKAVYATQYKPNMEVDIRKSFKNKKDRKNDELQFVRHTKSKILTTLNKQGEYTSKMTSQNIKNFLNETLSIEKMDVPPKNQSLVSEIFEKKRQLTGFDSSFSHFGKNKTEGDEQKYQGIKKRCAGLNFQKQLMKRKSKLMKKGENGKYDRFRAFVGENGSHNPSLKPQTNSVFYYFPIL